MQTIQLNNGVFMPQLGFGVFQIPDATQCEQAVLHALNTGYRSLDTAAVYANEKAVGRAVKNSGLTRQDVFLTSKVWIQDASYEKTKISFSKTLENLQTDYLDLYLIHMPYGDYLGAWRAMVELQQEGKIRAIGVCNFMADRLIDLILTSGVVPAVNQVELHPFCQQKVLRGLMHQYDIKPMAWAPFAEGQQNLFNHPVLVDIGKNYGKTAAQVVLRWIRQQGIITIPKSVNLSRIQQNFDIDDFVLSEQDMQKMNSMDYGKSLILDIHSINEAYRLHGITVEQ